VTGTDLATTVALMPRTEPTSGGADRTGRQVRDALHARRIERTTRRLPTPEDCRRLRLGAGLSLADVATAVGVGRSAVQRWELGQRTPREPLLSAYRAALEEMAEETHAAAS